MAKRPFPLLANLETAAPQVITSGSPIGALVALLREPGCNDRRGAVVVEVLAAGRGSAGQQAPAHRHRRPKESS